MNAEKHRRLMTILSKQGIKDDTRHDLVYYWTAGRTSSSRELFDQELTDLIWKIEHDFAFGHDITRSVDVLRQLALKQKRSIVLTIAQRTGIHEGTNFDKFNAFMETRSILKKRLIKYTIEELDDLVKQFRGLEANYLESAKKAGNKAWYQHYGFPEANEN
jgi:hypothetical protein